MSPAADGSPGQRLVCVGTYTAESGGQGGGIHLFREAIATRVLSAAGVVETPSPSWLQWHPRLPVLYAANEIPDGRITVFRAHAGGGLDELGRYDSGGADPCHLAITADGRHLLCSNYSSGTVQSRSIQPDGTLAEATVVVQLHAFTHRGRQDGPHAHMVSIAADGVHVSVVDLGADEIVTFRLGPRGELVRTAVATLPAGTGPRRLVREPGTTRAFVLGELSASVLELHESSPGRFRLITESATSASPQANQPAELELGGDALYVSNRGPDTIAVMSTQAGVRLVGEHPGGGRWPRHFRRDADRLYVCNQHDDALTVLRAPAATAPDWPVLTRYDVGSPAMVAVR